MELFNNMDWNMLRAQKLWLLEQPGDAALGLTHLLDALQDQAVLLGFSEHAVFGPSDDGEPCPYAVEIHNDYTPCQCSEERRRQCAQDI
jgi:hypothetical protein